MNDITIRRATSGDCQRLMELIRGLADYEKMPGEVTVSTEHFRESGFGQNPVWWTFVAEAGGQINGFALYFIRYSTWKGCQMYLEDIYVEPEMRGRGIGRMLFGRLIEEAKGRGLCAIKWQALTWNEPALNFYRKYYGAKFDNGWTDCSITVTT